MRSRGEFPAWLTRRGYFARLRRWTKPKRKPAAAQSPAAIAATAGDAVEPSNVLAFPEQPGSQRAGDVEARRRRGSA
ncbi:hypothetical protein MPOCJGCO_1546 [Methylobacterium trifolii]|uniref:Uncharacterized protein n=1 Tax=Methylobacterium trifolii TaxID=1003092 RepID=A0ABQ4TZL3_9HYPH|nr:hypothetical protein MPOCJGCO_1546 [Methylobacterium trifolii]